MSQLPQALFGSVDATPVDWRGVSIDQTDDDIELAETPDDVISMLGFDPLEAGFADANPYHEPAGSEKGGQFAKRPGGYGQPEPSGEGADLENDVELVKKFAAAQAAADAIPSTEHIDTPERNALRDRVADELYNKDIGKRVRNRESTIILGLPGVGKSTFANPLLDAGSLEVDPDLAKAKIPEFAGGIGAFAVHEESSTIARKVLQRAMANGDNFIWPRIDNPARIKTDIENLRKAGYKINVVFIDTDPRVAINSVIDRFVKTGRYVSPMVVKGYGDTPREAANVAKAVGVDKYEEYYRPLHGDTRRVK